MKTLTNFALASAFALGLTSCGKPTPEQIERIEKDSERTIGREEN